MKNQYEVVVVSREKTEMIKKFNTLLEAEQYVSHLMVDAETGEFIGKFRQSRRLISFKLELDQNGKPVELTTEKVEIGSWNKEEENGQNRKAI